MNNKTSMGIYKSVIWQIALVIVRKKKMIIAGR